MSTETKKKTALVSVCVPVKLRKRMTKFKKRHGFDVNWSKLASRAFRKHMDKVDGK